MPFTHGAVSRDDIDHIDHSETTGYMGGRMAASVILVRDAPQGLEVWVQERVSTMRNYPGVTVFPGGGVDKRDFPPRSWDSGDLWEGPSVVSVARRLGTTKYKAHALVFAAVRELFEETGTLLAVHADGSEVSDATPYHESRKALVSHEKSLTDVLREHDLKVRSDLVLPWARWVGASERGNWFDNYSFIAAAPEGQTPDGDTTEADDANWFSPGLLLEGWRAGLVRLVIPTWAQLAQLNRLDSVEEALTSAKNHVIAPILEDEGLADPMNKEFSVIRPQDRIGYGLYY